MCEQNLVVRIFCIIFAREEINNITEQNYGNYRRKYFERNK